MADIDFNDVALFVRVVEQQGFAKVARSLGVPTSTVSRAISRLEQGLGVRLVQRTTRSMQPTDEGRAFYAQVSPALSVVQGAAKDLEGSGHSPRGRLRITAPGDVGTTLLARVAVDFVARFPAVEIQIELTSRTVNLVEEGFDLAVRAGKLADSSLIARKLGNAGIDLYAAVSYVQSRGLPESLEALDRHDCVLFRPKDGKAEWNLVGPDGPVRVPVRGRIGGDDFSFVRAAILAGGGVGLLPRFSASAPGLMRVLPAYSARSGALYVVHPGARQVPAKVVAFRDFLVDAYARLSIA
jgi:DNA-binding transcriptional LysR family regulator